MKKTICKIVAFITTIIFYWGLLLEYRVNNFWRKDRWYWPDLKEVADLPFVFFYGIALQVLFVFVLVLFIQYHMVLVCLFAIIAGGVILGLLLLGAIHCVNANSKDD